ncbi:bifunctional 3-demethylubiquinone-9 3-methyltransferase/ 2-octaprenyl-6-hydroxy phenol methylase [Poriferisphaera corsica]|uniref:Bifunctional 3-demethylubiquinone-9 3-methyltransferase/ 2-octaprenyl-6-hydroxy phenol methylase n=1 Tax=Poriferisphaera corsica TaxID=2528020 RepID=A0A517YUQ5_9BACT|nr:class I SAM-dependent methyltransferase [Poriferisphaera corsica]QDU33961.1 bifunctional 3-demethylubiquinone-9 3-methyltransferase/ 2-octaprenyl-6-hydroxy phenol methylase [Poriferisphaera corsica]
MNTDNFEDTISHSFWDHEYKIPWHEADFSKRMLREHLTQEHDLASRRLEIIGRQVEWINQIAGDERFLKILDLGCGPGLYAHRLAKKGHEIKGIDFSPASIGYAKRHNRWQERCAFSQEDIRAGDYGMNYDLVIFLYGEFNVFSPTEMRLILKNIRESLRSTGRLLVELQIFKAIQGIGMSFGAEQHYECGLFSDQPHRCCIKNEWFSEQQIAVQRFHITEDQCKKTKTYTSTTQAYPDTALIEMFEDAGFCNVQCESLWPSANDGLVLWSANCR